MNKSRKQANAILDRFQPDLVVGTGGYASFPVVKAAAKRGFPPPFTSPTPSPA
ncbi:glycosyltransferase [Flavonifractor plautii]|nr:glycosyltransferase [Flavonifractor plautii]